MSQRTLFLLFFPLSLFSKDYAALFETLWTQQEYLHACEIADTYYHDYPDNINANLLYGRCALYRGNVDEAMAAFDRAEILDETDASVHQYLGDLYVRIGNFEIAKDEYDKADRFGNIPIPRAVVKLNPHRLSLLLRFSAGQDSNVNYSPTSTDLDDWSGDLSTSTQKPEAAFFLKEYVRLSHVYDADPFSSWYYKTQLHLYNKNYDTFHTEDLFQGDLESGPGWGTNTFDLWAPLRYTHVTTGYEGYLDIYAIHPTLRKRFDNRLLFILEAGFEYRRYLQWDTGDKSVYFGKIKLSRWFQNNYFRIGYSYNETQKQDTHSSMLFIDRTYSEFEIDYVRKLTRTLEAGLNYTYKMSQYSDRIHRSSTQIREDDFYQYGGYISYNIAKDIALLLQYNHYKNESNYVPSQYTKSIWEGGLALYF